MNKAQKNMPQVSGFYEGTVVHARTLPTRHRFDYSLSWFYIDLDKWQSLKQKSLLLSERKFNLGYSLRSEDHFQFFSPSNQTFRLTNKLGDIENTGSSKSQADALKTKAVAYLEAEAGPAAASKVSRVFYLGQLRFFGHVFNPVCFFYYFDETGNLLATLAQVTNTFGDQKDYLVQNSNPSSPQAALKDRQPKLFYVSPFIKYDVNFYFDLGYPGTSLRIVINSETQEEKPKTVLFASFAGKFIRFTRPRIYLTAIRFFMQSVKVVAGIHWQALRLYLKKIPFFRKEATDEKIKKEIQGIKQQQTQNSKGRASQTELIRNLKHKSTTKQKVKL